MKINLLFTLIIFVAPVFAQMSEKEVLEKGYEFYQKDKTKLDKHIASEYDVVVYATEEVYKTLSIADKVKLFDEYCNPPDQNDDTKYVMIDFKQVKQMTRIYIYVFTCGNTKDAPTIMYDVKAAGSLRGRSELNW